MKKIFAFFLAAVLAFGAFPAMTLAVAYTAKDYEVGELKVPKGYTFKLNWRSGTPVFHVDGYSYNCINGLYIVEKDNNGKSFLGLASINGNIVVDAIYDNISFGDNAFLCVGYNGNDDIFADFYNIDGKKMFSPQKTVNYQGNVYRLAMVTDFYDSLAVAYYATSPYVDETGRLSYYLDKNGKIFSVNGYTEFIEAGAFSGGFAVAKPLTLKFDEKGKIDIYETVNASKRILLNKNGNPIANLSPGFAGCEDGVLCYRDGAWAKYVDSQSREISYIINGNYSNYRENLLVVTDGFGYAEDKRGVMNKQGRWEISPSNAWIDTHKYYSEGLLGVRFADNRSWGFVDTAGKTIITGNYSFAYPFRNGLASAMVESNGGDYKIGFIDKNGDVVIPFEYDFSNGGYNFSTGNISSQFYDKYTIVAKDGKHIVLRNPLTAKQGDIPDTQTESTVTLPNDNLQKIDTMSYADKTINAYDLYPGNWDSDNTSLENYTGRYSGVYFENTKIDDYGLSCASLVKRFYKQVYSLDVAGLGDGGVPTGGFEATNAPQVGDIAKSFGHSAIIKAIDGDKAVLFEQNWGFGNTATINRRISISGSEYIFYHYTVSAADTQPSPWATASVDKAAALGLATADLTNGYQAATTRAEFCRAAVNFLRKYGYDVSRVTPKLFADTSDKDIGIAAALGITNGTDAAKNLFSPNATLTREQAATMLNRLLGVIGKSVDAKSVAWTDASAISAYAVQSVNSIYSAGVMNGTSTSGLVFSPKTPYTHEQSILTLFNLWEYLNKS